MLWGQGWKASYDDINTAFNNLSLNHNIKEITKSESESQDSALSIFKPLVLSATDILLDKKKREDVDSIGRVQSHNKNTSFKRG